MSFFSGAVVVVDSLPKGRLTLIVFWVASMTHIINPNVSP